MYVISVLYFLFNYIAPAMRVGDNIEHLTKVRFKAKIRTKTKRLKLEKKK